jgi:hypothetical protein
MSFPVYEMHKGSTMLQAEPLAAGTTMRSKDPVAMLYSERKPPVIFELLPIQRSAFATVSESGAFISVPVKILTKSPFDALNSVTEPEPDEGGLFATQMLVPS